MNCPRCAGLLLTESVIDYAESKDGRWTYRRCVCCGHVQDQVTLQNQALMRAGDWPKERRIIVQYQVKAQEVEA